MVAAFEAGKFAEAAPLLDELLAKFPDADVAYTLAKVLYAPVTGPLDNPQKLFAIVQQGALALPSSTYIRNEYGYALLARGRYADAIREFETYARMAPREPNPYDSLGEASLLMGHPEKAIENYSRALIIDPAFIGSHNGRAWSLATLGRFDEALAENPPAPHIKALILSRVGRYREAGEAIAAGIRDAESNENPESVAVLSLLAATFAIERKESARALEHTASAVRSMAAIPLAQKRGFLVAVDLIAGAAELQRGKIAAARSHLESQKRAYHAGSVAERWWHSALEGEIAFAGHDQDNAEAAFSGGAPSTRWFSFHTGLSAVLANDVLFRDGLARETVARGDLTGAIQIYRRLLTYGPAQNWVAAFEPRYVLAIARLLDRAGDSQAARREYERFLEF